MENLFELIAKFKINNKTYIIILANKSKVLFLGFEDGKLYTEISQEEKDICRKVYEAILINKETSIKIGHQNINGTAYKIFYDTTTKNYFWEAEKDKSFSNDEDNIILNFKYNHVPELMFDDIDSKKASPSSKKFYNKFVKIGRTIVSVALVANISLSALAGTTLAANKPSNESKDTKKTMSEMLENFEFFSVFEGKKEREYSYEEIKQAIESNPNLKEDEKGFLYKLKFVFDENNQYMDLDLIIERLRTIKIIYNPRTKEDEMASSAIGGTYSSSKNEINLYGVRDFEGCNLKIFTHEFFHVLQSDNTDRYTQELSNEFFVRETLRRMREGGLLEKKHFVDSTETFSDYGSGYSIHLYMYYALAEIMTEEELRNYQFSCDEKIIINALNRVDDGRNSVEKAYSLLESLDNLREYKKENNARTPKTHTEEQEKKCVNILNYFYNRFKKMNIEEDLNVIINKISYTELTHDVIEKTLIDNIDTSINDWYKSMLGKHTVLPKTYLSKSHKYPHISFYSPRIAEVTINENICKQYRANYNKSKNEHYEER